MASRGQVGVGQGVDFVLRRLCDDTYVPTQPWPVRWEVDAFYCSAAVAQLQQFGGATTISKLRGFLRSRVNATDNIKSVPLKAMLSGYPCFFTVRSNQVTLAPDPLLVNGGGPAAGAFLGVPAPFDAVRPKSVGSPHLGSPHLGSPPLPPGLHGLHSSSYGLQ